MKCIITFLLSAFTFSLAAQVPVDSAKQKNSLFHPTPKNQLRPFVTDRPGATESPYTLDAGHFQYETDLFSTEISKVAGVRTVINNYNNANIKFGITHSLDVQFIAATLYTSKVTEGNFTNKTSQFGGLTIRVKQNIWGDDSGKTALAILPFINFPTTSSDKLSGGIAIPLAIALRKGWNLGLQIETDLENDETGNDHHLNYLASATLSHSLVKNLDFFMEGVITRDSEFKTSEYFLDTGLVYSFTKNINADCGIYYGLKNSSSKTYFAGLSFRI